MLHIISLAQFGMAYTHGWAANSINSRIRLKAKCESVSYTHLTLPTTPYV